MVLQFDKKVSVESTVHVEWMAFREGILVVASSWWALTHSFVFESESNLFVSWVVVPSSPQ